MSLNSDFLFKDAKQSEILCKFELFFLSTAGLVRNNNNDLIIIELRGETYKFEVTINQETLSKNKEKRRKATITIPTCRFDSHDTGMLGSCKKQEIQS